MTGSRRWLAYGITGLLAVLAAISFSACQSSSATTASPAVESTQTVIPMITIVTPTPGKPDGSGTAATATTETGPTPNPNQSTSGQNGTYTVQAGDTLYGIAVRFKVTVQALMKANSITDPSSIQAGQVLVIP